MTEKCEAKWGVDVAAVQPVFSCFRYLANGVGAEVCQFLGFHIGPRLLERIEVRSLAGQSIMRRLRWDGSPSQIRMTERLVSMHFGEKVDQGFIVVRAGQGVFALICHDGSGYHLDSDRATVSSYNPSNPGVGDTGGPWPAITQDRGLSWHSTDPEHKVVCEVTLTTPESADCRPA